MLGGSLKVEKRLGVCQARLQIKGTEHLLEMLWSRRGGERVGVLKQLVHVWRPRLLLRLIGSRSAAAEATTASISFASGDVCQSYLPEMLRTQACMPCLLQVLRLMPGCRFTCLQREANIVYLGREKVKGVPHHAKAGNINNCLLKEGAGKVGHGAVAVMRLKAPGQMQPVGHVWLASRLSSRFMLS